MSFKEYASAVSLINRALGVISESKTISSLDDPGLIPTVANRWYKPVVARLLETHHWGLATKTSPMISASVNDRSDQWLYAYQPPIDMAFPVGISTDSGVANVSYYRALGSLIGSINGRPVLQYHNGKLYSNLAGALEYVSYDITEADFNSTFEDIVVLMLASRFAREIPKDYDLANDLEQKANSAINVAITQNLNVGQPQYGNRISEAELARGSFSGNSWDFVPRGPAA